MGNQDMNEKLWGVLGFFIPLAGLVLYLVWRQERPQDARYAKNGMIWGFVVWGILAVVRILLLLAYLLPFFN
jgi:Tfp pilus assembly protein PilN